MNIISLTSPLAILRITGADANSFLQGQFSNDLGRIRPAARYGLWLDHKGKVQADSFVLRLAENEFVLMSYFCPAERIREHLGRSLVADEVTLSDETAQWIGLAAGGEAAQTAAAHGGLELPEPGGCAGNDGVWCFGGRRVAAQNWEFLIPSAQEPGWREWLEKSGLKQVTPGELERVRVGDGIPAIPADIGPGDLPNEGGLDEVAVCYTKGCFLGQEVMARLKNLGRVRRRLHVVRGPGAPPLPRTAVMQGDKRIGETRSAAADGEEFVAMAMLSLANLDRSAGAALADGRALTLGEPAHE